MLNTLIWIIISILLIGFFAGIEIAFVSVNRLTVELKKKQGKTGGLIISEFMASPSTFISTTLIGFNLFLVVYGLLVGEILSPVWNWLLIKLQIPGAYVNMARLFVETFVAAFIVLLLGEFIPKAFWRAKNEWLLNPLFSRMVSLFSWMFSNVASFFIAIAEWILKYLFNVRLDERRDPFTRADLENIFQPVNEQGEELQELNTELFENALSLPNIKIRQCLIPRKEIIGIELNTPVEEARKKFIFTKLSKLVVYENNIDHVAGYIHQLDLFKRPGKVEDILLPIPAVPESMSATDLISKFSRDRKSIAWVVDEFGGTAGIVTMEDLLEEIFGEIQDEYDTEEFEEKKLSEDEYLFSGRLELDYLNEKYGFDLPADKAETLSGLLISQYEKIPKVKERIIFGNYEFDIMSVSDTRIEMARMKVLK